jgi:hypothetical protein
MSDSTTSSWKNEFGRVNSGFARDIKQICSPEFFCRALAVISDIACQAADDFRGRDVASNIKWKRPSGMGACSGQRNCANWPAGIGEPPGTRRRTVAFVA